MNKFISTVAALALVSTTLNAANMKYAEEQSANDGDYVEETQSDAVSKSNTPLNEVGVLIGSATYGLGLGVNYHRDLSPVTGDLGPGTLGVELGLILDLGETAGYYSYSVTNVNALATYRYAIDPHMSAKVKMGLAYSMYSWDYTGPSSIYWNTFDESSSDINLVYGLAFDYKIDDKVGTVGLAYYGGSWTNVVGVTYSYGF